MCQLQKTSDLDLIFTEIDMKTSNIRHGQNIVQGEYILQSLLISPYGARVHFQGKQLCNFHFYPPSQKRSTVKGKNLLH